MRSASSSSPLSNPNLHRLRPAPPSSPLLDDLIVSFDAPFGRCPQRIDDRAVADLCVPADECVAAMFDGGHCSE